MPSILKCILLLLTTIGLQSVFANSVYFRPLQEDDLPEDFIEISYWSDPQFSLSNRTGESLLKGNFTTDEATIRRFLEHGIYSYQLPETRSELRLKQIEETARKASEEWLKKPVEERNSDESRDAWDKQVEEFTRQREEIKEEVLSLFGCDGAFVDAKNRIYLWRLKHPTILELHSSDGGMCHLRLPERNPAVFRKMPRDEDLEKIPEISEESSVCGEIFPATGSRFILDRVLLRKFLREGVISTESVRDPSNRNRVITEFWFAIPTYNAKDYKDLDVAGNRIIGGIDRNYGQFSAIFTDIDGRPWKADLMTDCHLHLDDGHGRSMTLVLPEMIKEGHGIPEKTTDSTGLGR